MRYHVSKDFHVLRSYMTAVESIGDVPFTDQHRAVRRLGFPYLLEEAREA